MSINDTELFLPPDPEDMNNDRAEWADEAIRTFASTTNMDSAGEDDQTILTDLLGDLMHWCDRAGIDFNARVDMARLHYDEETNGVGRAGAPA